MSFRSWLAQKIMPNNPQYEDGRINHYPPWLKRFPLFREWSTEKSIDEGLKQSTWIYACIRKISESVSSVPWYVEKKVGDEWERVEHHPVEQLLRNPNPNPLITGTNLMKLEVNHRHLGGNAIWHKNMYNGTPVELWPIKPDRIYPMINEDGTIDNYKYRPQNQANEITIPVEEIIHFQFVDPSNFNWGMSPLQAAAKVVDTDIAAVSHNKQLLDNSAISSGAFTYNDNLTRQQWEEARERVREHMKNPGLPWILGNDAKWNQTGFSVEDLQILEQRKFSMYEIHAAFDVDPLLTGAPDASSRANKTEAKKEFWQDNIIPYLDSLKQGLEANLLVHWDNSHAVQTGEHQLRLNYDTSGISALREDFTEKVNNAQKLWQMGVPLNQVNSRLDLGFDDIPGGDTPRNTMQFASRGKLDGQKAKNDMPDAKKEMLWKQVEEDRNRWEERISEVFAEMFREEKELILTAVNSTTDVDNVISILDNRQTGWKRTMEDVYIPMLEYFGQQEFEAIAEEKGTGPSAKKQFDAFNERIQEWLGEHAAEQATFVLNTTKETMQRIFTEAQREGLTVDELAEKITERFGGWAEPMEDVDFSRAMMIARTESTMASGKAGFEGAIQARDEFNLTMTKTWISSRDSRVRTDHDIMDGETVPLDGSFSNGLDFPGDPSGPADEVINCRCTMTEQVI